MKTQRSHWQKKQSNISIDQARVWSERIELRIENLVRELNAQLGRLVCVGMFSPWFPKEPEIRNHLPAKIQSIARLFFPVERSDVGFSNGGWMDFVEMAEFPDRSQFKNGFLQTSVKRPSDFVSPALDIVLVPGTAFLLNGFRLGSGKGYYDRYFKKKPDALKIGLIYQTLLVGLDDAFAWIPDSWDIPVDKIIHEDGQVNCTSSADFPLK